MNAQSGPGGANLAALVLGAALALGWPSPAAAQHDGSTSHHVGGRGGHESGGQHGHGGQGLKRGQKPATNTGPGRGHDIERDVLRVPTDHTDASHGPPADRGSEQDGDRDGSAGTGAHDSGADHEREDDAEHLH